MTTYKRPRMYGPGSSASNPIVIPDAQVSRVLNRRTGGFMGKELKYADWDFDGTAQSTWSGDSNPTGVYLNSTAQGDAEQNRDGRQIKMKSLHIRGRVWSTTGQADGAPVLYRILVVMDKQANGAAPASGNLVMDNNTHPEHEFRKLENSHRFKVLKDLTLGVHSTVLNGNAAFTTTQGVFNININLNDIAAYDGTTAAENIVTNAISLYCVASNSSGSNLEYKSRLRFYA